MSLERSFTLCLYNWASYSYFIANPLKILRNEKECAPAMKIISWIKASFEPITKGWLRNLYLVIRDEENKSTIETYTFKFKYTEEKVDAEVYR